MKVRYRESTPADGIAAGIETRADVVEAGLITRGTARVDAVRVTIMTATPILARTIIDAHQGITAPGSGKMPSDLGVWARRKLANYSALGPFTEEDVSGEISFHNFLLSYICVFLAFFLHNLIP